MSAAITIWDSAGTTAQFNKDWGVENAGDIIAGVKQFVENTGTRTLTGLKAEIAAVDPSDGNTMLRIALDTTTVVPPWDLAASVGSAGAGGVWSAAADYSYVITATNATGETQISREVTATVDVVTKKVTLTWQAPSGATGYKIYRTATAGSYNTPSLRATISSGATTTYLDDGSATSAGAAPSDNTTAGAGSDYGSSPVLGQSTISFGTLAKYQMGVYWVGWVLPIAADEAQNPRQAKVKFSETSS